MEFCFVDNNAPVNGNNLKNVRSHVMKGRNLGKTIPTRGWKRQRCKEEAANLPSRPPQLRRHLDGLSPFSLFSGAEMSSVAPGMTLTPSTRHLIHQFHASLCNDLYPAVFCLPAHGNRSSWFEHMLSDPSALHCILAVTSSYLAQCQGLGHETVDVVRHFSHAMQLLQRDLENTKMAQKRDWDPSIAVVLALAMHANLMGAVSESRIHLDGLRGVLTLRPGGLPALYVDRREIANKVRRAETDLSMLTGAPLQLVFQPAPAVPRVTGTLSLATCHGHVPLPSPLEQVSAPLQNVMQDILALCHCAGPETPLDGYEYQDIVISITQRLLDYAPLSGRRPWQALNDAIHLGLLAFMTTLMYRNSNIRIFYGRRLSNLFHEKLSPPNDDSIHAYPALRLWLVLSYSFLAEKEQQRSPDWLITHHMEGLASELDIRFWEDAKEQISGFPWVTEIHDSHGKKLWNSCLARSID